MANSKISALTSATTPLAGTEVLPIVQSSTTVKVATNDLTVRNVRANATTGILQVTGPAAASTRVMTVPDANFTAARTDTGQTFTGNQIIEGTFQARASSGNFTGVDVAYGGVDNPLFNFNMNDGSPRYRFNMNSDVDIKFQTIVAGGWGTAWQVDRVTRNVTVNTGNVVIGTAGKGIDFSANSHATGMTSELLTWYEEGTWTPTFTSSGGAFSSVTYNSITGGRYTRIGNVVQIQAAIGTNAITIGAVSGNVWIEGLPFTAVTDTGSTDDGFSAISIGYSSNFAASVPTHGYVTSNQKRIELYTRTTSNGASSALNITNLSTTDKNYIYFSAVYICA